MIKTVHAEANDESLKSFDELAAGKLLVLVGVDISRFSIATEYYFSHVDAVQRSERIAKE